jgi:5-methylcytosine-specific restriction endonuclease McrA
MKYNWEEVQEYYDLGYSRKECIAHFGMASSCWHNAVKRKCLLPKQFGNKIIPLDELSTDNRKTARDTIKSRLIKNGIWVNKCHNEKCNIIDTWLDKPISLQLDHKNGNSNDNRMENLWLLCPNCHSQTQTYGGRNIKKNKMQV